MAGSLARHRAGCECPQPFLKAIWAAARLHCPYNWGPILQRLPGNAAPGSARPEPARLQGAHCARPLRARGRAVQTLLMRNARLCSWDRAMEEQEFFPPPFSLPHLTSALRPLLGEASRRLLWPVLDLEVLLGPKVAKPRSARRRQEHPHGACSRCLAGRRQMCNPVLLPWSWGLRPYP